jgi:hypothetical protein
MNRGKRPVSLRSGGYTIVETLIFLAVSAGIFFAAVQLIGGQQGKAQFVNAVRDFETKLTDIANDVSTGYYQNGTTFNCDAVPTGPDPQPGARTQGTNEGCIFTGTVVKFGEGASEDDRTKFTQFTMAGLRTDPSTGLNTATLVAAKPKVVNINGAYSTQLLSYGASIQCVYAGTAPAPPCNNTANGALGFFTRFTGVSPSGGNSIQTDILLYPSPVTIDSPALTEVNDINSASYASGLNPAGGVTVCLKSATTSQYALVHIGGTGNNLTFSSEIKSGTLCS